MLGLLLATAAFAAPDDLRLGADLRLRGYHADHDDLTRRAAPVLPLGNDDARTGDLFGRGRLQLHARADWTDTLSSHVTVRGDGTWAQRGLDDDGQIDVSEAWVRLENPAFLPLSLNIGRQGAHHGRGLILSGRDGDWILDAARVEYDVFSSALELMYASVAHLSPNTPIDHFWWAAARRDTGRNRPGELEAYVGAFSAADDAQPLLVGVRGFVAPTPRWELSAEGAYEFGERSGGNALSAFVADLGLSRRFPEAAWKPALNTRWTFASGDDECGGKRTFVPLLNHEEWGRVFSPRLSNIHILGVGAEMSPRPALKLALDVYEYVQVESAAGPASDGLFNNGGYLVPASGRHHTLGTELDLRVGYEWRPGTLLELSAGRFMPGAAYDGHPHDQDATELCAEVRVKF
ncbi:MAG: alginate export family protein [Kiritimatiellae bacterium]|nr:alginate export family protein [Kiritimatiellia bacterium]